MDEPRPDPATLLGFSATVVLIGLNVVAVRLSNVELAPFWGATLRYVVASVLILLIVAGRRIPLPRGRALSASVLFGALNFGVFYALMYWALVEVPAGAASVVLAATPLFTYLMALTYRLERFRWDALLGAAIVIVGIALLAFQPGDAGAPPLRMAAVVGATFAIAAAGIVVKRAPRAHPIGVNAVGMVAGTVVLVVVTWVAQDPVTFAVSPTTWGVLIFLILSSILLFVLVVWLIGRWTASGVAYAGVLAPIVTVVVAHLAMDEPVTPHLFLGGALVALGVYLGALRHGRPGSGQGGTAAPEPSLQK